MEYYEEGIVASHRPRYSGTIIQSGTFHYTGLTATTTFIKRFILRHTGWLYVTDQRLIFQGLERNVYRSIELESVLQFKLFQDGMLLAMDSNQQLLLKFHQIIFPNKPTDPLVINDGLNVMTRLVVRTLNKDY